MLITNTPQLYEAMLKGEKFKLTDEGQIHTHTKLSAFKERTQKLSPEEITKKEHSLQLSMATMVEYEARSNVGPQNLKHPLPLGGETFEDMLKSASLILGHSMVDYLTKNILKDAPSPILTGAIPYLQARWEKEHPEGPADIFTIQGYVERTVLELQSYPGNPLAQLACGYTLGPQELEGHMQCLKESFQTTIKETWHKNHKDDFDLEGLYSIYKKDSGRERPVIQGERFPVEEHNTEAAVKLYCDKLKKEFSEVSMRGVVGICLSQTVLADFSKMVMGIDTAHPLNPFGDKNSVTMPPIMSLISTESKVPRLTLSHSEDSILLGYNYGITIKDPLGGMEQEVGSVSFMIKINKDQFPLPLGTAPNIDIVDMRVDRMVSFTGKPQV